ncbi:MAG: hypothetical protein ABFC57_18970 [Veillonellales bacterium]
MSMRQQFVNSTEEILRDDPKTVLLLGDIGVFGFRNAFERFPTRVYNIGILEQATIGLAAGLALEGCIPIVHTIAPFLVERAFEQLKIDFGYQQLGGNFVSAGASYDYAALGCTHHCPGDVGILLNLPGMEIVVPGTSHEFARLLHASYDNGHSTYFRLSEQENESSFAVEFGKGAVIREGNLATVIAVGPVLSTVMAACSDMDITILYYTCINPIDTDLLLHHCSSGKVLFCEPYFSGGIAYSLLSEIPCTFAKVDAVGVPHKFLRKYGTKKEQDETAGLTPENIRIRIERLIDE